MFLPAYSPELNPVERLWRWLRGEVTHNTLLFQKLEDMMGASEKEFRYLDKEVLKLKEPYLAEIRL